MHITDYVGMIYLANNLNKTKSQPQVFMLFQIGNYNQTIVNVKLMFHMCMLVWLQPTQTEICLETDS